jgi:uncharacterized FlgJ-related protein
MIATNNQNTVYNVARNEGASDTFARIVLAQMLHESANFTSNVFKSNNNPLGMKVPSVRKSPYIIGAGTNAPANEGKTPYAKYASLGDATHDLFHWLRFNKVDFQKITTPELYAAVLKQKGYYGDTQQNYSNAITRFFTQLSSVAFTSGGVGLVVFVVASIALFLFLTIKNK